MRAQFILKLSLVLVASVAKAELAEVGDTDGRGRPDTGGTSSRVQNVVDCGYLIQEYAHTSDHFYTRDLHNILKPIRPDSPEKAIVLDEGSQDKCGTCSGLNRSAGLLLKSGAYTVPYTQEIRERAINEESDYVGLNIQGTDVSGLFVLQMDDYVVQENLKGSSHFAMGVSVFWPHANETWQQEVAKERSRFNNVSAARASAEQESVMLERVEKILHSNLREAARVMAKEYREQAGNLKSLKETQTEREVEMTKLAGERSSLIESIQRQSRSLTALKQQLTPGMNGLVRSSVERDIRTRETELSEMKSRLSIVDRNHRYYEQRASERADRLPKLEAEVARLKAKLDEDTAKLKEKVNPACAGYF